MEVRLSRNALSSIISVEVKNKVTNVNPRERIVFGWGGSGQTSLPRLSVATEGEEASTYSAEVHAVCSEFSRAGVETRS